MRSTASCLSRCNVGLKTLFSLEGPQEINDFLLLLSSHPKEMFDDLICLAAIALVISDGFHQVGRPPIMEEECEASNAQDALMIGKTSRAVAMKYARPTTPKTANTAKDTFSTVMPSFGLMGSVFHFSDQQ